MQHPSPQVLVVDDEQNILRTIGICLDSIGFACAQFTDPLQALDEARTRHFDLAFIDLRMAPIDGMECMRELRRISPDTTAVIITAHGSIDSAVEAVKQGAYSYLQKPFEFAELQHFALKAWEHHQLRTELRELRSALQPQPDASTFITRNNRVRDQIDLALRVADSGISVLIEGESGTGKELIAHLLHERSSRAAKPFVRVNCAALPEQLLESELFGHVRGSFTGAVKDRQGRFELANGGTLFLDEIADIAPGTQAKLLRVLENGEFERLGESLPRKVQVRLITATNRNLDQAVQEGTFREDLFYRLNSVRIKMLPLRERPEDIALLGLHFLKEFASGRTISFSSEALRIMKLYRWPGNVRELKHAVERAVLLADTEHILPAHLPPEILEHVERTPPPLSLEELERRHIQHVLHVTSDYQEAASILGIDPATLWRKRKRLNL